MVGCLGMVRGGWFGVVGGFQYYDQVDIPYFTYFYSNCCKLFLEYFTGQRIILGAEYYFDALVVVGNLFYDNALYDSNLLLLT